ncbi:MAG TPA: nickel/cobalt efflux transporter [Cellvibrionaceae bacterium]
MDQFSELLNQGAAHAWWFLPTALSIGALHGLEPGHSKSLMAAFIIAVRGTWQQAMVLGLCVAISHSAIVWCIAAVGLYFGPQAQELLSEGRLTQISGVLVILVASWMLWNLLRLRRRHNHSEQYTHGHDDHDHSHDDHSHNDDSHDDHSHEHDPNVRSSARTYVIPAEDAAALSAHDLGHARDIQRRFAAGQASWGQIIVFGLSGGLIPCPASIAVLALCLQAQQVAIGFALVVAFSLGLALTLTASGLIAALGFKHAQQRLPWINRIGVYAPWLSACLMLVVGSYLIVG